MPSLIHPTKRVLPTHSFNDTLGATLRSGKKCPDTIYCANNNRDRNQTIRLKNTELYEKPVFRAIIFLMFQLNLSVHLYCANYLTN